MSDGRAKRKVWVFSKEAKIPRTTVWRTQKKGGCITTDLPIATLHSIDLDIIEPSPSPTIFESLTDSEKDDLYTQARRRGGSKGSNEPPLKFDNGGLKYK